MQRRKLLTVGGMVGTGIGLVGSIGSATMPTNDGKKMTEDPLRMDYSHYLNHEPTRKMLEREAFILEKSRDHLLIYLNKDHFQQYSDILGVDDEVTLSDIHEYTDEMLEKRLEKRNRISISQRLSTSLEGAGNNKSHTQSRGSTIVIGEDDDLFHPNTLEVVEKDIPASIGSIYGNGMTETGYPLNPGFHFEALPTGGLGTMDMECFHYRSISVEGSSAEIGNIAGEAVFEGFLFSAGSSINVESELVVMNGDTGTVETADLYSQSGSWFDRTVGENESSSVDIYLAPGHDYHIGYRMSTTISVGGGGASVDFGSVEYNRYGDYVISGKPEVYFY